MTEILSPSLLEAVARWERERAQLDDRIRVGHDLLDLLDPLPAEMLASIDPPPPAKADPVPAERKPKPKVAQVACPDCGQMMHPQGLGPHRSRKHPGSAAKPVRLDPAATETPDADTEPFSCLDCGEDRATTEGLAEHVWAKHKRPLKARERTPDRRLGAAS